MVKINLSKRQIAALEAGKNVNVRPEQIGVGDVEVDMDEYQLERIQKAAASRSGRGVRIGGGKPKAPVVTGSNFGGSLMDDITALRGVSWGGGISDPGGVHAAERAARAARQAQDAARREQYAKNKAAAAAKAAAATSGGKIKLPSAKKMKQAAALAKMVGDTGAQMYGYDSLVDAGVSAAQAKAASAGYDNKATRAVAKAAKKRGNKLVDQQLEGGKIKVNWKKVGKTAAKVGKVANNISKAATGESLSDMAISYGLENTIGRVDPTGGLATDMISNQLQKEANKQIDKQGGSFYSKRGGDIGVGNSGHAQAIVRSKYQDSNENPSRWVSVRRFQL